MYLNQVCHAFILFKVTSFDNVDIIKYNFVIIDSINTDKPNEKPKIYCPTIQDQYLGKNELDTVSFVLIQIWKFKNSACE